MLEFDFIERMRTMAQQLPSNGFEGIGDDCAVLNIADDEALVFTADTLIEGVHFLRNATSPGELGAKSIEVNLSDVAAMGARPVAVMLSLSVPQELMSEQWAIQFAEGCRAALQRCGAALIGGDTTLSLGTIAISITAIGRTPLSHLKRRSAAIIGDVIFVGGELGTSAAGLRDILAGRLSTAAATTHRSPQAQCSEGEWLGARAEVHAMMDISDGTLSDLPHILHASKVGARIELSRIPRTECATEEDAIAGGEDYKLLFTVAADYAAQLQRDFELQFHSQIYPIGTICAGDSIEWQRDGTPTRLDIAAFSHFK